MTGNIQDERASNSTALQDVTDIEQRIEQLMRERHRLAEAFDALADNISATLSAGRPPLAQIAELDQLNRRLRQLDDSLTEEMNDAAKKVFAFSESEYGGSML